jgi:DNA-binding XRE family transcriptional regulator
VLTGKKLLETAGIPRSPDHPGRAWQTLERNLQALQAIGGLGHVAWEAGEQHTLEGHCHLHPPTWVRDRLVHGLFPEEAGRDAELLTGSDLAEWRRSLGLSQEALAGQLALSERTIRRAERAPEESLTPLLRKALALFQRPEMMPSKS